MSAENTQSRPLPGNAPARAANRSDTARLEAFSDGVFAIAITLLVLNIRVPLASELKGHTLLEALSQQWPAYLAYVVSFVTILLMWVGHHNMFTFIQRIDHTFLLLNGLLLMGIAIVPFPTGLLAEYLPHTNYMDQQTAAAVASLTFAFIAAMYDVLYWYAVTGQRLITPARQAPVPRTPLVIYMVGPLLYLVAAGLALWAPSFGVKASLAIFALLVVLYALPVTSQRSGS
jgi:uncharacterized membrane protein